MGIISIDVDFSAFIGLNSISSKFDLNGRPCEFLYTDTKDDGTRIGRFKYEDGETFNVTYRYFYGMSYEKDEHRSITWDYLKGWSLCLQPTPKAKTER